MPKQDNTTEEDYLDDLLNSVLSNADEGELKDDFFGQSDAFDDELKGLAGSDEDFFQSIEKDWIDGETEPVKEEATPEKIAKETFEKYKDPVTEEYRDVPIDAVHEYPSAPAETADSVVPENEQPEQELEEISSEPVNDTAEESNVSEESVSEDDMKGLMDILGVEEQNENEAENQEIADLEKSNTKDRKSVV